jgi:hypothetical protein
VEGESQNSSPKFVLLLPSFHSGTEGKVEDCGSCELEQVQRFSLEATQWNGYY